MEHIVDKSLTHHQKPALHLHSIGDKVAVVRRLVGDIEPKGNTKVAGDNDDGWNGQVHGKHADDEGRAVLLHLAPGQCAGQAEWLRAIPAPAQ